MKEGFSLSRKHRAAGFDFADEPQVKSALDLSRDITTA
jgi:hypothetical protein